jgi:hypothetical protein
VGERRNAYTILVDDPKWKRPVGIPKHSSEDNIKVDCKEGPYSIFLAIDRNQYCDLGNEPSDLMKDGDFLTS